MHFKKVYKGKNPDKGRSVKVVKSGTRIIRKPKHKAKNAGN